MKTQQRRLASTWFHRRDVQVTFSTFYAVVLGCVACSSDGNGTSDMTSSEPAGSSMGGVGGTSDSGGAKSTGGTVSSGPGENSMGGTGGTGVSGGTKSADATGGSPISSTTGAAGSSTVVDCDPLGLSDWSPPAYVPPRHVKACSATEIADYYDRCLFGSDCAAFVGSGLSAACGACLAPSGYADTTYGPILLAQSAPSYIYLSNTSGCIDLMGEPECGAKIQTADSCARAACTEPCTVSGLLNYEAFQGCMQAARTTVCAKYVTAAACIVDPTHAAACRGADSGFRSLYTALANVFCG